MEACTSRLPLRPVQSFSIGRVGGGRDSIHVFSKPQRPEFLNNSHLTDHNHGLSITCDGKKDAGMVLSKGTVKKKLKLLKGLSTDLSMYTKMAADGDASIGMLSDLAQILMSQLEQMKEQKKEMKRKRKEEKKLNTSKMKLSKKDKNSSANPSESNSSNSELKEAFLANSSSKLVEPIHAKIKGEAVLDCSTSARSENTNSAATELFAERIDVCMGGKCRKFGGAELLDQLQKKIGVQGAVVGCKCLGLCRNAPSVRVSTNSVTGPENPMNITGVGLEDVDMIASRFLCDQRRNVGRMEAA